MPKNMQEAIKLLQETAVVMSGIQARRAEPVKEHSQQWHQEHDQAIISHDREIAERQAYGRELDARIDKLVSEIREYLRRNGSGERGK